MTVDTVVEITDLKQFEEILASDLPVLVDFWAPWCGPCQSMLPIVSSLAKQYHNSLTVVKLNIDDFPDKARVYEIRSIPHCILFHEGVVKGKIIGLQSLQTLAEFVKEHVPTLQG